MSGFFGCLGLDGTPVDPDLPPSVAASLAWRGPDHQETWSEGSIGLSRAWLDTADGTRDRPPSLQLSETRIVGDVRLDGRRGLIRQLPSRGFSSQTSDEALVVAAYETWGLDCLRYLHGEFAFLLWDGQQQRLFAARDRLGIKPFFHARVGRQLLCANTLATLRRWPGVSTELRPRAIADYLLFGANQDLATTSFAAIDRLPPAHRLLASPRGGEPRIERYWSRPAPRSARRRPRPDDVETYRDLLRLAVEERMTSSRATVFLSGGMDSTTVAALAQESLLRRSSSPALRAVTVVYEHRIPDRERQYAAAVAEASALDWQVVPADDYRLFAGWDDGTALPPEPVDGHMLRLNHDLYRQAAAHGPLALSGDGGDPALVPSSGAFLQLLREGQWRLAAGYWLDAWRWSRRPPPLGLRTGLHRRRVARGWREKVPDWLAPELVREHDLEERWRQVRYLETAGDEGGDRPEAVLALADPFWVSFFESRDPGATGVPLEIRSPLFDQRLLDFSLELAPSWCLDKRLLRMATAGILPKEVRNRPKTPLAGTPRHPFDRSVRELLDRCKLAEVWIFQYVRERSFREWLHREREFSDLDHGAMRALGLAFWLTDLAAEEDGRE